VRTKIGIVYDIMTGQVRRVIVPDDDSHLAAHANVSHGEAFHIEYHPGPFSLTDIPAIVQRVTGKMLT
jgi:hypothetical protein